MFRDEAFEGNMMLEPSDKNGDYNNIEIVINGDAEEPIFVKVKFYQNQENEERIRVRFERKSGDLLEWRRVLKQIQ